MTLMDYRSSGKREKDPDPEQPEGPKNVAPACDFAFPPDLLRL